MFCHFDLSLDRLKIETDVVSAATMSPSSKVPEQTDEAERGSGSVMVR